MPPPPPPCRLPAADLCLLPAGLPAERRHQDLGQLRNDTAVPAGAAAARRGAGGLGQAALAGLAVCPMSTLNPGACAGSSLRGFCFLSIPVSSSGRAIHPFLILTPPQTCRGGGAGSGTAAADGGGSTGRGPSDRGWAGGGTSRGKRSGATSWRSALVERAPRAAAGFRHAAVNQRRGAAWLCGQDSGKKVCAL